MVRCKRTPRPVARPSEANDPFGVMPGPLPAAGPPARAGRSAGPEDRRRADASVAVCGDARRIAIRKSARLPSLWNS